MKEICSKCRHMIMSSYANICTNSNRQSAIRCGGECEPKSGSLGYPYCAYYKPKNKTRAEYIREMSDKELAEHFSKLIKDTKEHEYCTSVSNWLNWLQSEVEEENE